MKLLFSEFWEPLALEEGEFASLVVEHPPTFRALVADLHGQICGGLPGECVLSEDGRPLELSRCAELFVEVVPFPGARRSLLTRAAAALERRAVAAEQYERTLSLLAQVERFLWELCDELPLTVDTQRLTVGGPAETGGSVDRPGGGGRPADGARLYGPGGAAGARQAVPVRQPARLLCLR